MIFGCTCSVNKFYTQVHIACALSFQTKRQMVAEKIPRRSNQRQSLATLSKIYGGCGQWCYEMNDPTVVIVWLLKGALKVWTNTTPSLLLKRKEKNRVRTNSHCSSFPLGLHTRNPEHTPSSGHVPLDSCRWFSLRRWASATCDRYHFCQKVSPSVLLH